MLCIYDTEVATDGSSGAVVGCDLNDSLQTLHKAAATQSLNAVERLLLVGLSAGFLRTLSSVVLHLGLKRLPGLALAVCFADILVFNSI